MGPAALPLLNFGLGVAKDLIGNQTSLSDQAMGSEYMANNNLSEPSNSKNKGFYKDGGTTQSIINIEKGELGVDQKGHIVEDYTDDRFSPHSVSGRDNPNNIIKTKADFIIPKKHAKAYKSGDKIVRQSLIRRIQKQASDSNYKKRGGMVYRNGGGVSDSTNAVLPIPYIPTADKQDMFSNWYQQQYPDTPSSTVDKRTQMLFDEDFYNKEMQRRDSVERSSIPTFKNGGSVPKYQEGGLTFKDGKVLYDDKWYDVKDLKKNIHGNIYYKGKALQTGFTGPGLFNTKDIPSLGDFYDEVETYRKTMKDAPPASEEQTIPEGVDIYSGENPYSVGEIPTGEEAFPIQTQARTSQGAPQPNYQMALTPNYLQALAGVNRPLMESQMGSIERQAPEAVTLDQGALDQQLAGTPTTEQMEDVDARLAGQSGFNPLDALAYAPTALNAIAALQRPEQFDPIVNPNEAESLDVLRGRQIDDRAIQNRIDSERAVADRNARIGVGPSGSIHQRLRQNYGTAARTAAEANVQAQQLNNQYLGEYSNALNNFGQQRVAAEDRALTRNIGTRANRANFLTAATSGLSTAYQGGQRNKLLEDMLYGANPELSAIKQRASTQRDESQEARNTIRARNQAERRVNRSNRRLG